MARLNRVRRHRHRHRHRPAAVWAVTVDVARAWLGRSAAACLIFGAAASAAGTDALDAKAPTVGGRSAPRLQLGGVDSAQSTPLPARSAAPAEPYIGAATWRRLGDLYSARAAAAYERARQLGDDAAPTLPGSVGALAAATPPANVPLAAPSTRAVSTLSAVSGAPATTSRFPSTTSTPPTANRAGLPPAAARGDDDDVAQRAVAAALQAWAAHWRSRDAAAYLADYTADFTGHAPDRAAWVSARRDRLAAAARIDVQLSDLAVEAHGPMAVARFTQRYRSDTYTDISRKYVRLEWNAAKGAWLIAREAVVE